MTATYDFSQTRNDIITRALRITGVVADEGDPTPKQMKDGAQALESLVKWLQAEGTQLWTIEDRTLTLVVGQAAYTTTDLLVNDMPDDEHAAHTPPDLLVNDMLVVMNGRIVDSNGYAYGTGIVEEHIFRNVSQPSKSGRPEMVNVELRASTPTFNFWPVPDLAYTWQYKVVRKLADFDNAVGTPEMPQRWYDPLVYTLAANLADEYQLPLTERSYLAAKAQSMRKIAANLDSDPADMIYLNPV